MGGKGLIINGLTNDIYKTEYPIIEDRMHPPLEPIVELPDARQDSTTIRDLLNIAKEKLGDGAILEFSTELIVSMTDPTTGETEPVFKRMASLTENALTGTGGAQKQMDLTYRIDGSEDYLDKTLTEIDQPPMTIIRARNGEDSIYLEITGDREWFFDYSQYG